MRVRRAAAVVLCCAAATLAGGCGGDAPPAPETVASTAPASRGAVVRRAPLRTTACGDLPGFRCATLRVPLHRRGGHRGDGRRLALAVAVQDVARAPHGDLVLLAGGPGQPGRPFGPRMLARLGTALEGFRLVLLDQRGTGAGALRCPALQRAVGSSDLAVPPRAAVEDCARRLGSARDAFATADTVADLDALRAALGTPRWVVAGISYGVLVAERYALAHPRQTRGLVLDSVVPQEGVELLDRVPLRATARVLRAVCAEPAPRCASDPARDLAAVTAARTALGPTLFDALTALSIGVPRLDGVPALLRRARAGDLAPLRQLLRQTRREAAAPVGLFSAGLHAATLCADGPAPWPGGPEAGAAARTAALARLHDLPSAASAPFPPATALAHGLVATCRWWPPVAAPPPTPRGAVIGTPALLLAGDRDLSTPLEWARAQAARMPRGELVVVPGAGHSILSRAVDPRGRTALRRFLRGLR
jgi:pimeloyl-ACP methyl ester carboxylesterase